MQPQRRHRSAKRKTGPAAGLLALSILLAGPGWAQEGVQSEDLVNIVVLSDSVVAINPRTGPVAQLDLDLGEYVVGVRGSGQIGIAATNRRLLGISTRSATWAELRYRISEVVQPVRVVIADRVALVPFAGRLVALSADSPTWQEFRLSPEEHIERAASGENLVLVVTRRRAVAFGRSGFVAQALTPRERIRGLSIDDHSIALTTTYRVLIFQSGARNWTWIRE